MTEENKKLTRAERNIKWIEDYLHFPDGPKVGLPMKLAEFQKDWIRRIYDNPVPVSEVVISIPRKNSKTTTVAALCLLHLVGPESIENSQLYSCANDRQQAAITLDQMKRMINMNPRLQKACRIVESKKEIYCDGRGTRYRANSRDATGAVGSNPAFIIHDEQGQISGPIDSLYDAMATGVGVQKAPLKLLISTQAAKDGDFFSIKIDEFKNHPEPHKVLILHTCPEDHPDIFSEDALRQANPAWDEFINKEELLKLAQTAKNSPSQENSYRNFILNQRIAGEAPFVSRALWEMNKGDVEDIAGKDVYIGVDLSQKNDVTGMVCMYQNADGKTYSVKTYAYLPEHGLFDKAKAERTPWDIWAKQGFLTTNHGKTVDYGMLARDIYELSLICNIKKIAVDPYNSKYFTPKLIEAGLPEDWIEEKYHPFQQGFISMSGGVAELERLFMEGLLTHGDNPCLREAFQNAKVITDPRGNRKFDKFTDVRKKDLADCSAMAAALLKMAGLEDKPKPKSSYRVYAI